MLEAADNKYSYITVLSTDSYVEGVVVLNRSLHRSGACYPLFVLVTSNVADSTLKLLEQHEIEYRRIEPIELNVQVSQQQSHWQWTYSKLEIFNQVQFDKLVYVDADMLVYHNLDELFEKPHMSAVNAGGRLPQYQHWTDLNSGLMVVEPARQLYEDMLAKLPELYKPAGGDQDFLNAYYPDWSHWTECHLDHAYNLFHTHIDQYQQLYGYQLNGGRNPIKVVHFIGGQKPWLIKDDIMPPLPNRMKQKVKYGVADAVRFVRRYAPKSLRRYLPEAIGAKLKQQALQHWLQTYQA